MTTPAVTEPDGAITAPGLIRSLTLRDLVFFHIVAVVSLRWLATAGAAGPSSITLWVLAALFFFTPQGLAVSELASRYPDAGGIYEWTKRAYGEGHGFLCGWCYWVNNVLYPPNILMATAVIATYALGKSDGTLASSWSYVLPMTLGMLWFAVALNIVGVSTGKWLQNIGAFGNFIPGLILLGLGAYALTQVGHHVLEMERTWCPTWVISPRSICGRRSRLPLRASSWRRSWRGRQRTRPGHCAARS